MARLLRGDEDLAAVEVAGAMGERTRGLLGRDGVDGALWIEPCRSVHSLGMRFDLDVAFLDRDGVVLRTCRLPRSRMTRVVWRARTVLEAEAGAFTRWGLAVGDRLAVAAEPPAP